MDVRASPRTRAAWRLTLGVAVGVVVARGVLATMATTPAGQPPPRNVIDVLAPAAVALLMAHTAWRSRHRGTRLPVAWGFLAGAYLAYALAELLGLLLDVSTTSGSPASIASFGLYLLFYPLFMIGSLSLPSAPLTVRERRPLLLDIAIIVLSVGLVLWILQVRPAVEQGGWQPLRLLVTVAYPVGDLAALWGLLTLMLLRREGSQTTTISLLAGGAGCMIASDLAYAYFLLHPTRLTPSAPILIDSGWTAGIALAGLAAVRQLLTGADSEKALDVAEPRRQSRGSLHLAYTCMLLAITVLVSTHLATLSVVSGIAALTLICLVVARQTMWLAENERLSEELRVAYTTLEQRVQERTADLARANQGLTAEIEVRQRAERRTQLQLERLAALRAIDAAIASSLDLRLTLDVFLDKVVAQLRVDAAEVLLLESSSQTLESVASRGFASCPSGGERVALGEGPAGRAALELDLVRSTDLATDGYASPRGGRLVAGGYRACWAVPLQAKGQVRGVLEVFAREVWEPEPEWLEFLVTLGGQGALAVDNMTLFESIRRSNVELVRAYESTLEGWSRALELRDRETQGHTLRVTEAAMRLARAAGIDGDELVHVRRGALLHDIGKMGIPDSILLKPGPLTDAEWEVMRLHPVYAFQLLSHIPYLRPALDIPYCHHERWDGGGYPRGLRGAEIPLAARLFSMVDTWDALRHERPYREAWPAERVLEHIRSAAGGQFDPRLVDLFLAAPPDV